VHVAGRCPADASCLGWQDQFDGRFGQRLSDRDRQADADEEAHGFRVVELRRVGLAGLVLII